MLRTSLYTFLISGTFMGASSMPAFAQDGDRANPENRSAVQRKARLSEGTQGAQQPPAGPAVFPRDFRTIDGIFNNLHDPEWGAAGIALNRSVMNAYADGTDAPSGADRPNVRDISNLVCAQDGVSMMNSLGYSDFIWQWGQFLDHDIDETPIADPAEHFDILVPVGDPWFDPFSTGIATMPLDRSAYVYSEGVRQQINNITAYIDASNVYGSEEERTHELRTNDGTGKLKTSAGDLLPYNTNGIDNVPSFDASLFLAGDIRANEQVVLTAMHTLFVREHNRRAQMIAGARPELSGDEVFERARAIVAGEMQAITYNEFLPKLLGEDAIPRYHGYLGSVDAGISNLFATAAYRVGHTMLSTEVLRVDADGEVSAEGNLDLASAFFNPGEIEDHGIDSLLRGLASQKAQEIDVFVVDDVRNFLFGAPGSGGLDLPSLNLQRGRDHGLPSYNAVREAFGRDQVTSFDQINPDPEIHTRLSAAYSDVGQVDAWIGLLAEPHREGAFVGETLMRVLRDQFLRLRDGDRFWYESYLPRPLVEDVNRMTLARIIRANTEIGMELQDDVFAVIQGCVGDFAEPYGEMDFLDISEFIHLYTSQNPDADMNHDGLFDFLDVSMFLNSYSSGCE